jgi:hypothetical protein
MPKHGLFLLLPQVSLNFCLIIQVVSNDRVDIGQSESRIMADDFLSGVALLKGVNNCVERDSRIAHPPLHKTP